MKNLPYYLAGAAVLILLLAVFALTDRYEALQSAERIELYRLLAGASCR